MPLPRLTSGSNIPEPKRVQQRGVRDRVAAATAAAALVIVARIGAGSGIVRGRILQQEQDVLVAERRGQHEIERLGDLWIETETR